MRPDTLGSLIHHCSKNRAHRHGISLHGVVVKSGMESDVYISNHVLNMYAKCGKMVTARQLFDEMPERNLVSWSAMISGYDQAGEPVMAVDMFSGIQNQPNEYVFASAISSCASLMAPALGGQIHAKAFKLGYSSVSFVGNSLVSMYMTCKRPRDALSVFSCMSEPDSVSFNAIIAGLTENQQAEKGFEMFKHMVRQGFVPDRFTFAGILNSNSLKDLWIGMGLHCQTIKLKLDLTAFVGNVIVTMYSKFNLIENAEKVFRLIVEKDVISWNTFIAACSQCLDYEKGLSVFKEMIKDSSSIPDDFTCATVLATCSSLASLPHGKQIHAYLIRARINNDVGVGNALVDMYAKCGSIHHALTAFNQMGFRNIVSWNSIISGFANHGFGEKALKFYEQMKESGIKPDSVTFVLLLVACNHSGLVDEGAAYFNSMDEIYGVAPGIEHVSCFVDLLGRAGRLKEAEGYIEKFSLGDDPLVLGCLLSACRLHGDVVTGERLAKRILKVKPCTTSPYVLLSNLYASDRIWDGVAGARKMLKCSGLRKEAGHSLIEVQGSVEKFTISSFSHSRIQEIVDVLQTLSWAVLRMVI